MIFQRKIMTLIAAASLGVAPGLVATTQASAASPGPATAVTAPVLPTIAGGSRAALNKGTVALWAGENFRCGGSYLGNGWVITAKHCVEEQPVDNWRIQAGSLSKNGGRQLNAVNADIKKYGTGPSDIALLPVTGNTDGLTPTNLTNSGAGAPDGSTVFTRGWGRKADGSLPTLLRKCDKEVTFTGQSNQLFFMDRGTGNTRAGDSGGPVFQLGAQIGVLSRSGDETGMSDEFASATNLTDGAIRQWIRDNTGV